jgi:hypothetical protein
MDVTIVELHSRRYVGIRKGRVSTAIFLNRLGFLISGAICDVTDG